jgi:hypothetical protein
MPRIFRTYKYVSRVTPHPIAYSILLKMAFSTQALSCAFIVFFFAFLVSRYRRLQSIPGPLLASFTDLWRVYHQNFGKYSHTLVKLHKVHGPFVRVGPNAVSIGDTSAMSSIYTMHGEFRKVSRLPHRFSTCC